VIGTCRESRLIVGAQVLSERDWATMQPVVDELPLAEHYYSDDLAVYSDVIWPDHPDGNKARQHQVSEGKRDTYTVEGMNADLRTYLGRLKRRSRCFSRCIHALRRAVRLFVWFYNKRQRLINHAPRFKNNLCLVF